MNISVKIAGLCLPSVAREKLRIKKSLLIRDAQGLLTPDYTYINTFLVPNKAELPRLLTFIGVLLNLEYLIGNESFNIKGRITNIDFSKGTVKLSYDTQSILNEANCLKLKDCDLGTFVMDSENIKDNWALAEYNIGDPGYWFPLVDYGNFSESSGVNDTQVSTRVEDFRPWFSPYHLLSDGFRKLGWCFESPYFESRLGRRQWRYLSHSKSINDSIISTNAMAIESDDSLESFDLTGSSPDGLFIPFQNTNLGTSGLYSNTINYIQLINSYGFPIEAEVCINMDVNITSPDFDICIATANLPSTGTPTNIIYTLIWSGGTLGPVNANLCTRVTIPPQHFIFLSVCNGRGSITSREATFNVLPSNFYLSGSEMQVNCAIDPDLTLLDLLKAEQQLINGILDIDQLGKKITLYPNDTVIAWGEKIQGFYKPTYLSEQLNKQVCGKLSFRSDSNRQQGEYYIGFKETTDAFIQCGIEEGKYNKGIYNKSLEHPNGGVKHKKAQLLNNLYEPTLNAPASEKITSNPRYIPVIPRLWDNKENNLSHDLGFRAIIGCYTGASVDGFQKPLSFLFNDSNMFNIPLGWDFLPDSILLDDSWYKGQNITFNQTGNNYQSIFYNDLISHINNMYIDVEVLMSYKEFKRLDFRKYYHINTLLPGIKSSFLVSVDNAEWKGTNHKEQLTRLTLRPYNYSEY